MFYFMKINTGFLFSSTTCCLLHVRRELNRFFSLLIWHFNFCFAQLFCSSHRQKAEKILLISEWWRIWWRISPLMIFSGRNSRGFSQRSPRDGRAGPTWGTAPVTARWTWTGISGLSGLQRAALSCWSPQHSPRSSSGLWSASFGNKTEHLNKNKSK